jgi:hypothetical protein
MKEHIAQEYSSDSVIFADQESFKYFKNLAAQAKATGQPQAAAQPLPNVILKEPAKIEQTVVKPSVEPKAYVEPKAFDTNKHSPSDVAQIVQEPPKPQQEVPGPKNFKRELPSPPNVEDFADIRKVWNDKFPQQQPIDTLLAKAISHKDQQTNTLAPEIILLSIASTPRENTFLSHVAIAIDQCIAPAKLIEATAFESDKEWQKLLESSSLKYIIACHHKLNALPELMKFYHEDSSHGRHTLGRVPLLLLSDLSLYMQEPKLKRLLWQTLCQTLPMKKR